MNEPRDPAYKGWMLRCLRVFVPVVLTFLSPFGAHAQSLRLDRSEERLRVDGALREWRGARFSTLGESEDAAVRFSLATAEGDGFYVAAEVSDERLVRRAGVGSRQDALVLTLAFPRSDARRLVQTEVWLHPGEPGKSRAQAGVARGGEAPRVEADIKIVEGPRPGGAGYVIEAFVPWRLIAGAEIWEQGRGGLRFEDVDSEASPRVDSVLNTGSSSSALGLPLELGAGQNDLFRGFLEAQALLGTAPRFDFRAQVAGDLRTERVVIVDRFGMVYGPGYKQGEGYSILALPLGSGGSVLRAELRDMTGDGHLDLVCVVRQVSQVGSRDVWWVATFADEEPRLVFGLELRKQTREGVVESDLEVRPLARGAMGVRVAAGRAQGLTSDTYQETRSSDVEPMLLPWGDVLARTYQFQGGRFVVVDEKPNPKRRAFAGASPKLGPTAAARAPEAVPGVAPAMEEVLALFKEQRGVPKNARASRHLRADFVGTDAEEDLFAFGAHLVFVGPDIGGGASYFAYALPIANPSDLCHLGAADVTGDRKAELFVRVKRRLGEDVMRGVMTVHRFEGASQLSRILMVEAFRAQGDARIENQVQTAGGQLIMRPGKAVGWNQQTYPFADGQVGDVAPLLLPWKDREVRYRFRGGNLTVARP